MTRQYLRSARLRVGSSGTLEKEYSGFRISFRVEKNLDSTPNTCAITVYNLNQDSRTRVEAKDAIASLDVGYGGQHQQIFMGTVARAETKLTGPDTTTEIECGDGEKAILEATVDQSFPPGATSENVMKDLTSLLTSVKDGGVTAVKNFAVGLMKSFGNGLSLSGTVASALDTLTASTGTEWSVQDGEIQILELNKGTPEPAHILNSSTGLVGSPGRLKAKGNDKKEINGIQFECLLEPKLRPGRLVKVESTGLSGTYRLTKVTHEGDTHGGAWLTKCEGVIPA